MSLKREFVNYREQRIRWTRFGNVRVDGGWRFTDRGEMAGHLYFDNFKITIAHKRYFIRLADSFGLVHDDAERWVLTSDTMAAPTAFDLADFIGACARVEAFVCFLTTNKRLEQ